MRLSLHAILLATSAIALAQGPGGPRNSGWANHPVSNLNMTKVQTVTGAVTAVDTAYGAQYPTITVARNVIKVAPIWFFLDQGFELKAGDQVRVTAAPSLLSGDSYLYAIDITNIGTNEKIVLRDSSGVPLWTGPPSRGNAVAPRNGTGCIEPASIASVAGTVDKVSMGAGIQMPSLVVKTSDGQLIAMKIGPERILLASDFELNVGERVTAKYGIAACTDENVAIQLTNAAGVTVVLRDDDGMPAWN